MTGWLARLRPWLAVVLAGLFGAWLGLNVAGTTHTDVGPLSVNAEISPALTGETVVQVAPLGTLVFDTHAAPLRVTLDIRSLDVGAVQQIVENPAAISALQGQLVGDLDDALTRAAIQAALAAVLGAAITGGLLLRSWRRALLAGAVAVAAVGVSAGAAVATFDREAVRSPHYTGLLAAAPQVIGTAETIAANFEAYAEQLGGLVTNISRIYDTTLSLPTWAPTDDMIRVLHVADLHLNPAAWGIIRAIADQYDVDVIVDAGDIADHGTAPEAQYVQPIRTLGRPYIFVKGNHDSVLIVRAVEENPNAIVLDHEPVTVAGLRFLGAPDPRFTPDQSTRGTADADIREASERLAETAENLTPPADVLVFHDPTHAELLDGRAPIILAGHAHRRRIVSLEEGTTLFVQGTTGGAGLRALEHEEPMPVQLSVLYFDPETKRLAAWDDITLGGLGLSSAEIERHQAPPEGEIVEDFPDAPVAPEMDDALPRTYGR